MKSADLSTPWGRALGVAVGLLVVVGIALFLNDSDGPTQGLGAVEVDVGGSGATELAPEDGLDDPVEILDQDASPAPATLGEAGPCRFLDPVTVRVEGKPLRVSLGPTILAGLWDGFEVGPLVVVESSLLRLHPPPSFVVAAVVSQDGEEIGVGAWISSDRMALFDPSFGVEQYEFRQEPLAYPHATTVRAANNVAAQASAFEPTESNVAPDARAVRCARTVGGEIRKP